jgi:hypothetical protein
MAIAGERTGLLFQGCLGRAGAGPYLVLVGGLDPGTHKQRLSRGETLHDECR